MKVIEIQVNEQNIRMYKTTSPIIEKSRNYIKFVFEFLKGWDGYTKTAIFESEDVRYTQLLNEENECYLPDKCGRTYNLSLMGIKGDSIITTNILTDYQGRTLYDGESKEYEPEPTIYEQILKAIGQIEAGNVSDEQIKEAVEAYLKENPVSGGASEEEIVEIVTEYLINNPPEPGENGKPGIDGTDGVSPTVEIEDMADGCKVTITDVNGQKSFIVLDGEDGEDGVSPTVDVEEITGGHKVTITDVNGPKSFEVLDGEDGNGTGTGEADGSGTATDNLAGKKILFIGDSICEGVGANGQPYPYWIGQWHENTTIYNLGVGGMTIAQKDESITNSMPVRIASGEFENADYANADILVFEGGINDFMNNVKHGYIQKSYNITKYDTFCRGMEYMFQYFKNLFPKARMIFCSTHNLTAYDFNKAQSWWGAAGEICAKWGVEFLDLFSLICTAKIEGLQLHPTYNVHRDYYAPFINRALASEVPLSAPITTHYYAMNPICTLYFHSGTQSFPQNTKVSTGDWRINMIRCDGTTYENVTSNVEYDFSDVDTTTEGIYPVHFVYSENGINIANDVDITITGSNVTKSLSSITATKTITNYTVGDEVTNDDITVTANYTDGSTADVTENAVIDTSNINNTTAGEYNIAISYTENDITKTTAIQINILNSGGTTVIAEGVAKDVNNQEIVSWTLDSQGVITFDSTVSNVSMASYDDTNQPWYSYMSQVEKAIFASNITGTGSNVLANATNLIEVELQNESVTLGANAFSGCTSLMQSDWTHAKSVTTFTFRNCPMTELTFGETTLGANSIYRPVVKKVTWMGTPSSIAASAFYGADNLTDIYVPWAEGEVANAPWGATNATVHYSTV